ncbi:hypothetical protein HMPREF9695_00675 [Afipia broomeae ATCC 49717]|uniref:Uncharacterized protein n=1 Tax=Afipia broomeae ATCC 49717 TaxID=883078 RepID=K8PT68_9BRAD|nr:hypothetical protein HMPREF9695_00675 [Afipia broomeae ATCC 49717]
MQTQIGKFTHSGLSSRRNWIVCWRWSLAVLAVEFAIVIALIGFAANSRSVAPVKSSSQVEQAKQNSTHSRKACPLGNLQKTQSL